MQQAALFLKDKSSTLHLNNLNKILKIKNANFKNYLINVSLGYFVIALVIISLNVFYVEYARSIEGIMLNAMVVFMMQVLTLEIIKKVFEGEM